MSMEQNGVWIWKCNDLNIIKNFNQIQIQILFTSRNICTKWHLVKRRGEQKKCGLYKQCQIARRVCVPLSLSCLKFIDSVLCIAYDNDDEDNERRNKYFMALLILAPLTVRISKC